MSGASNPGVNFQQFFTETTAAIGPSASFTSAVFDCEGFESFAISIFLQRNVADTDVDYFVENSLDGITFRQVDTKNLPLSTAEPTQIVNRVYSVTRSFMRVRLVNNTVNGLLATELIVGQKEIA